MTETAQRVPAGVDPHRDTHVVAALDERDGELGVQAFAATAAGYRQSLPWLRRLGPVERIGVEGTGTYGAGLTRYLHDQGVTVIEVTGPNRRRRRRHGKSDPVDALAAARAAQGGKATAHPETRTGNVEAIGALRIARRSAAKARNDALNQMRALLVTGPKTGGPPIGAAPGGAWWTAPPGCVLPIRAPSSGPPSSRCELARRVQALEAETERIDAVLVPLVAATAPGPVARHGVGPDTAGALLVSAGDNPGRLHSEAAFAHLCGPSPIDASSGLVVRRRLNRGGDRRADEARWRTVMVRMVSHPPTRQLRRAAHQRGTLQTRDHPLPQTLRRPRALPLPNQPPTNPFQSIGASLPRQ